MVITVEALCNGSSLQVQQDSLSAEETNWNQQQANDFVYLCSTATCPNLAEYDYFLAEKSLAAFAIFHAQSQETTKALQTLLVQVRQHHHLLGTERLAESSIEMYQTSDVSHGCSRLHPAIPVVSITQASPTSAETTPSATVPFRGLCPSPCRVRHHCSAYPALSHHHPHHPHPAHHRNFQDDSDCLQ
jgi:hypothetical protein